MKYMEKKNLLVIALGAVCIILLAGFLYSNLGPGFGKIVLKPEKAKELVLAYIDESILQGTLKSEVEGDVKEESGVYKMEIKIDTDKFPVYVTKDGKLLFPQAISLSTTTEEGENKSVAGSFTQSSDEICLENGKPVIYFFGSESCPHCIWEHPIIQEVAAKFGTNISFHNNMDNDADSDIFSKYSTGGIPTIVLGCKYYRVGSGENMGEEKEKEALESLICELTNNQPAEVCSVK